MPLSGRQIVLGITGGIAAYKTPDLIRHLVKSGAAVRAVLTRNGEYFVTRATLETVTRQPVITTLFPENREISTEHITLADWADCLLVAPATADIIGKFAHAIADDFLSTFYLSFRKPVILAPSMNEAMYSHVGVQANLSTLIQRGVFLVEPAEGELACRATGKGRLPDTETLLFSLSKTLTRQDLSGRRLLITCGGTEEALDPVRVLSNRSSGKMGIALARNAAERGARVTLIHGRTDTPPPPFLNPLAVTSAAEMKQAVATHFKSADMLIMAAAVADFKPVQPAGQKIKKGKKPLSLTLVATEDILAAVGKTKGKRKIVGFALESDRLIESAHEKMARKGCDLMIANAPATLGSDNISFSILEKKGHIHTFDHKNKTEAARLILDFAAEL